MPRESPVDSSLFDDDLDLAGRIAWAHDVRLELAKLSTDQMTAIDLVYRAGLTYRDAAGRMGTSVDRVTSLTASALRQLSTGYA